MQIKGEMKMDEIEKFRKMVRRYHTLRNISAVMCDQYIYSIEQKIKKQNGRAERQRRTHQLIFIGCIWDNFLRNNNLSDFYDVNFFTNVLNKIAPKVNVAEEYLFFENENFDLPVAAYNGRDKNIIHRYCQIGGTWESFWRSVCKNDTRDKRIYKIFTQIERENFDIIKINDDDFIDFKFFCNEKHCQKIGAFNSFFKSHCLKLDAKFFYLFLSAHKSDIIDALIQS